MDENEMNMTSFNETNSTDAGPEPTVNPSVKFFLEVILLSIVSVVGMFCNLLSVLVLLRKSMRVAIFNRFLAMLAAFDLVYLMMSMAIFTLPELWADYQKALYIDILPVGYGIAHIGRVGSVFLTAAVTIERCLNSLIKILDIKLIKI